MKYEDILNKLLVKIFNSPLVKKFWSKYYKAKVFYNTPWTRLKKPLSDCKIVLISTGGIILKRDKPFDLNNPYGDSSFRRIPNDVKDEDLTISHKYYDHKDADLDPNLILPFQVLNILQKDGLVGSSNNYHYSSMGHLKDPLISDLINKSALKVINELKDQKVDIDVLVQF